MLLWTAEGKTSSEAATILSLSERTVNFHINNAIMKLRAANKTQAVVKAALLGLLF
jgi:LuxR family transcriptional regulator, quorum-sensing system regulator SolR